MDYNTRSKQNGLLSKIFEATSIQNNIINCVALQLVNNKKCIPKKRTLGNPLKQGALPFLLVRWPPRSRLPPMLQVAAVREGHWGRWVPRRSAKGLTAEMSNKLTSSSYLRPTFILQTAQPLSIAALRSVQTQKVCCRRPSAGPRPGERSPESLSHHHGHRPVHAGIKEEKQTQAQVPKGAPNGWSLGFHPGRFPLPRSTPGTGEAEAKNGGGALHSAPATWPETERLSTATARALPACPGLGHREAGVGTERGAENPRRRPGRVRDPEWWWGYDDRHRSF